MKAVIQRVKHASVEVEGKIVGSCNEGFLVLLGVAEGDTEREAEMLCRKIVNLRIFEDDAGKMNRSLLDIDGELLVVSQFTLLANYRHGNRPDFMASAKPDEANRLYEYFKELAKKELRRVESGIFGADMKVSLLNDGPVTIVMDSDVLKSKK
ncbi:MAG: D-tyrosyl-tRNA(Tyr) deacylase [Ruminococcaceae bacterium]|nr:D-tyrosyl-tRNA(Tyr) deacylase [Oscillospiraceae bacterium]